MANDGKFLNLTSGLPSQEQAINTSAGAGDADKLARLDAAGRWSTTMMPVGIVAETVSVVTSENLSAGNLVNIYNNGGTLNARKADGTAAGKPADGFVLAGTTSPASATVYIEEALNTSASGLTIGGDVFLDVTTAGLATSTTPTGSAKVAQLVGKAISATSFIFRRGYPITLA